MQTRCILSGGVTLLHRADLVWPPFPVIDHFFEGYVFLCLVCDRVCIA